MPTIFISHATDDDKIVDQIYEAITAAGLTAWVDHQKGITFGDNWLHEIEQGINDCDFGLFLMSPQSILSDFCKKECLYLLQSGKKLYVAMIEAVAKIPLLFIDIQYADLTTGVDENMASLTALMQGETDTGPGAPTAIRGMGRDC